MDFLRLKQYVLRLAVAVPALMGTAFCFFPVFAAGEMEAAYNIYLNGRGWSNESADNTYCQAPPDSYVTGLKATLRNQPEGMTGTIAYQVNLSGSGWLNWEENYAQTGTTTTAMPLEAVRMQLTGQLSENYDLYYSVLQNGGWTELVMNGQTAGLEGQGLRVDGLRVAVRKKGSGVPEEPKPVITDRVIDPSKPMVALTFDDGPSRATARILDSLEANGGRATFFIVGNRISGYRTSVKRMTDIGCEAASHTWDHTYITKLSEGALLSNLAQADNAVRSAGATPSVLVRPPGGYLNDAAKAALAKRGSPAIMWSIDTLDWKTKDPQKTVSAVLDHVKDGDIILMHDLYETTADAAAVIIPELTKRGYQLVTVSELAGYRGGMQAGHVYNRFRP